MSQEYTYILIVDDQAGLRRLLFDALISDEGHIVEMAENGVEAIRKVRSRIPSLILLDVRMPGMSGLETMEEIKKTAPDVPVILMTAYAEHEMAEEAYKRGALCCINKPFDLEEIRNLIKEILAEGKARERDRQFIR